MIPIPYIGFFESPEVLESVYGTPVEIPAGERFVVIREFCKMTGLREDNGSNGYLDKGTIVTIALIGRDPAGSVFELHNYGGLIHTDYVSAAHPSDERDLGDGDSKLIAPHNGSIEEAWGYYKDGMAIEGNTGVHPSENPIRFAFYTGASTMFARLAAAGETNDAWRVSALLSETRAELAEFMQRVKETGFLD